MRRLTRVAAFVAAASIALSSGASAGHRSWRAGPPLRYLGGPPGTLDPAFIADAADVQLLLQLYAGLTRLDETGEPYPSLASGWEISDDGLTYDVHDSRGSRRSATARRSSPRTCAARGCACSTRRPARPRRTC